jgi:curli biogenesis system outer membrane secretion channel CsgG
MPACLILGCGDPQQLKVQIGTELAAKQNISIAVLPFERGEPGADHNETWWSMTSVKDAGSLVSDMFTTELLRVPGFRLVERSQINRVLQELDLSLTDLISKKSAQQIGQLLGVEAVILGSVSDYRQSRDWTGGSSSVFSYSMRMVDVLTGTVLVSASISDFSGGYDVNAKCQHSVQGVVDEIIKKRAGKSPSHP